MRIRIAGAGAGKTTAMASTIIQLRSELDEHLKIFCVTFTNNAAKCVSDKLQAHYNCIPNNIVVSTIHSFLYQEFVKPYYYLLYGKQYGRISTTVLSNNSQYRAAAIKRLEDKNVLHQTAIPQRAKWIVSKKSKDNNAIKKRRSAIMKFIKSYCGAICIDEAQDIDDDMLEIFETLHELGIPVVLMGDPKQDLNNRKCLRTLMDKYTEMVEYSTICYRCPQKHLDLSNSFIADDEKQYSDKSSGTIDLVFASDMDIKELINEGQFDLKYISQRKGIFETHVDEKNKDVREALCEEISIIIRDKKKTTDELRLMKASYYLGEKLLQFYEECKNKQVATNKLFNLIKVNNRTAYGIIINLIPNDEDVNQEDQIFVSSIDSIKGQEGENCLFILTTDLAAYLLGEKTEENAFKNRLYVALTRSLDKLAIYVTDEVEAKYGKADIKDFFKRYGYDNQ